MNVIENKKKLIRLELLFYCNAKSNYEKMYLFSNSV